MSHPTSDAAEQAFYEAFRTGNLEAMRETWAAHDSVYCIHPRGDPLLGREAVMESWRDILDRGAVDIHAEPVSSSVGANLAVHLVSEQLLDPEGRIVGLVLATNVYELTDGGWRMLMHHASPAPPPSGPRGQSLH